MDKLKWASIGLAILILLAIVFSVFFAIFYVFYLLSYALTTPGSILMFFVSLYLFLHLIIRVLVFPGSFKLWKRSVESSLCREAAGHLLRRVQDLHSALDLFASNNTMSYIQNIALESTSQCKRLTENYIEVYKKKEAEGQLTPYQASMMNELESFKKALSDAVLISGARVKLNLWDWMDYENDLRNIIFEDSPANQKYIRALERCVSIENRLLDSCKELPCCASMGRWFRDTTFATSDLLRSELELNFYAEQIWLNASDGVQIDCLWLMKSSQPGDEATMIYCNPNGGVYEFSIYQTDWIEFYLNQGINVFLWNYRGYGRTKGKPSPSNAKRDGEIIVDYLRRIRKVIRLGVHGESLGGMIATHIAKNCKVDFLFADRTFSALKNVARYSYGKFLSSLLQVSTCWKDDSASDFLESECYKVLSADPQDNVIVELASLKCGVAKKIIENDQYDGKSLDLEKNTYILSPEELETMANNITKLMYLIEDSTKKDKEGNSGASIDLTSNSIYHLVGKDAEHDDEMICSILYKVLFAIDLIDAGGKTLSSISVDIKKKLSLNMWLINLDVWGSFLPLSNDNLGGAREKSIQKLSNSISEIQNILNEYGHLSNPKVIEICDLIRSLDQLMQKIKTHMETYGNRGKESIQSPTVSEASTLTTRSLIDSLRTGFLITLECGHSGHMNTLERAVLVAHLTKAGLLG